MTFPPISKRRFAWMLSLCLCLGALLSLYATRSYWLEAWAKSLVYTGAAEKSDVILIENFDTKYLLFERAARLRKAGMGDRILVPVQAVGDSNEPGLVSLKIAEVMCQVARIPDPEIVAVREKEPYSINLARQVAVRLQANGARSVLVVTDGFRSRRTYLIYQSVLSRPGIRVSCSPVFSGHRPDNWTKSPHGIQQVVEQFIKLQYYRWVVL